MKRIIAAIMILVLAVTLSGCKEVPSFMPSYWDGLTKAGAREYVQNALRDKYGEEFVVKKLAKRSGYYYTNLLADCSPISDESLVFQVECWNFKYHDRDFVDTYIQSIVGREMEYELDSVMSNFFSDYVLQIYVYGLSSSYDSGIHSSAEASIKRYTELVPDNLSIIDIILNDNEASNFDSMERAIKEFTPYIYNTTATIRCYRVPPDILNECNKCSKASSSDKDVELIVSARYPEHTFHFNGENGELKLISTFLCECSYCLPQD